jgi:hypothetical protein
MSKIVKIIIAVVIVLVVVFFIYKVASSQTENKDKEATTRVDYTTADNAATSGEAAALLRTLKNLEKVELNGDIFSDPAFTVLFDFSKVLTPIDKYRQNPFAPIGAPNTLSRKSASLEIEGTVGAQPSGTSTATTTR